MMKFLHKKTFLLLFGILQLSTVVGQTNGVEKLCQEYYETTNPVLKIQKAPAAVTALTNYNESQKARNLITDVEKVTVDATKQNLKKGLVLLCKATLLKSEDSLNKSKEYIQKALPFLDNYKNYLADGQSMLVMNYYMQGKFDSCIYFENKFISNIRKSKSIICELEVLMCAGRAYDFIGDRKKAVEVSLEGVELAKQYKKNLKLSEIYISLSSIYKGEDIQTAKKYALLSAKVLEDSNESAESMIRNASYLILGNVYHDLHMEDSAMYYYYLDRKSVV